MTNALHHPHQVHHHVPWSVIAALVVMFIMILGLFLAPTISLPAQISAPSIDKQGVYVEYLRGEKVMYTNPLELNKALTAYYAGEKPIYANPADRNTATWAYHLGEMSAALNFEDALWQYRFGEWNAALNLEDAMWEYRMGEKGLR